MVVVVVVAPVVAEAGSVAVPVAVPALPAGSVAAAGALWTADAPPVLCAKAAGAEAISNEAAPARISLWFMEISRSGVQIFGKQNPETNAISYRVWFMDVSALLLKS